MMIMNGSDVMSPGACASLPTSSTSPGETGFTHMHLTSNGPPVCIGCSQVILDEFILRVQGRLWHACCLRCCTCHVALKQNCFSNGSHLYCEEDFLRLFGTQCAGCGEGIAPTENVRRAHENIYHVTCFTCIVCESALDTGDEFFLRDDGRLICSNDYNSIKHTDEQERVEVPEKKSRSCLTEVQLRILTSAFISCPKPSRQMRDVLSSQTGLDQRVIQVWFQNKRAKSKKGNGSGSDTCAEETHSSNTSPCGFPLPIVNGDFSPAYHQPQPKNDFIQLPDFLTMTASGIQGSPWNATPEMWEGNFVPPNVDLLPGDIQDGEVCSTKRGEVTWDGHEQLINCRH